MNNMEVSQSRAEQFDKVEGTALSVIQEYLEGKRQGGDDIVVARTTLAVVAKNRQTTTAREALKYNMVQDLQDPKVRKAYVKATQPQIQKLLKER